MNEQQASRVDDAAVERALAAYRDSTESRTTHGTAHDDWTRNAMRAALEAARRPGGDAVEREPHLTSQLAASQPLSMIAFGHKSHDWMASKVRMLMRGDLDHEPVCTGARDRIVWLAARVEQLEALIANQPVAGDAVRDPLVELLGPDVMVCQIGDYSALEKREWATVLYDDKKVAECYTDEDAKLIGRALRALAVTATPAGRTYATHDEWRISEERTKLQAANLVLAAELATANENLRLSHLALESAQSSLYAKAATPAGQDAKCAHDWRIWPETNGQEQKCLLCGAYRQTPCTPTVRTRQRGGIDDGGPYNGIDWPETLRAAAKRLRLGVEGPRIADELDSIAEALSASAARSGGDAVARLPAAWRRGAEAMEAMDNPGVAFLARAEGYRVCASHLDAALQPNTTGEAGK